MPSRLATAAAIATAMAPAVPAQAWRGPESHAPLNREALVQQCAGQIGHSTRLVTLQTDGFSYQPDITRLNVTELAAEDDIKSGDGRTVNIDASVNTLKQGLCYGYVDNHSATHAVDSESGHDRTGTIVAGIGAAVAYSLIFGSMIVVHERRRNTRQTNDQTNSSL